MHKKKNHYKPKESGEDFITTALAVVQGRSKQERTRIKEEKGRYTAIQIRSKQKKKRKGGKQQAKLEVFDMEENLENGEAEQQPKLDGSKNREMSKKGDATIQQLEHAFKILNLRPILYSFTKELTVVDIAAA